MPDLSRLLRPRSIAVIGGGAWCRNVIEQCRRMDFQGALWWVHPRPDEVSDVPAFASVDDLPEPPDASFVGVNRHATVEVVGQLSSVGAGGAVCFASGFLEAEQEDAEGAGLQRRLLDATADMPILGPNCYGLINYLDGALLWPDQHGGRREEGGVAIVTQSSNIAINLTMQRRGLPIAYMATAGNQAQLGIAEIGAALLSDPRVTALGLYIEGFGDLRAFEALAARARDLAKPVVALKVGRTDQARAATVTHTASLAGGEAGAQALLDRLGIARVHSLSELLETMKLLHVHGPLASRNIASISCSGGEACLMADSASDRTLSFPPLTDRQRSALRDVLGPKVALANPLDYHTYIWNDREAMTRAWAAMMDDPVDLTLLVVDFPRTDRCSEEAWENAISAALDARENSGRPVAMVSTLPENMSEAVADRLISGGVVPLMGADDALAAAEAAAWLGSHLSSAEPIALPLPTNDPETLGEAEAKALLSAAGVPVPNGETAAGPDEAADAARRIGFPVVLKGQGIEHKTEAGAVVVDLATAEEVRQAALAMPAETFLVEEMVADPVAELLVGVVRDPAHGYVLTLAAGGTLTELLRDSRSLLLPCTEEAVASALQDLNIAKLLNGYRGRPAADVSAILAAIASVQKFVLDHVGEVEEIEINPLLCGSASAVAVDALVRMGKAPA